MPTREQQEREARLFFEQIYAGQPDGTVAAIGPFLKPHFVYKPAESLSYVVDRRDVYTRVSLLGKRPSSGRGKAEDSVAMLAVWADIDVNGGPKSNGGVVTDGARDIDHAIELAHRILQPTLMVGSGYGVQPWWLFEAPWPLADADARTLAKELSACWQRRVRHEAEQLGVSQLDSTHDLARVLRVPGSLNAKGGQPVPVVLLDDGGPRYSRAQIANEALEEEPAPRRADAASADVDALLDRHPNLAKLVARKGRAPGDGSGHAWDFRLACRAMEHDRTDAEVAALIRHARAQHDDPKGKGERGDYVETTVAKARASVGKPSAERDADDARAELANLIGVARRGIGVSDTVVAGHGGDARARIVLDNGYEIEFPRFEHIAMPNKLGAQLATTIAVAAEFTTIQARRAAALVREIATRDIEAYEREIAENYGVQVLRLAEPIAFDLTDQASRWWAWQTLDARDPLREAYDPRSAPAYARAMLVARDTTTGQRFIRAGWMQHYLRLEAGAAISMATVRGQLLELGWAQPGYKGRIKATDPARESPPLALPFYVVPPGWEDEL